MSIKEGWGGLKKVYVAGPMSGIPEFNFPAFFAAERKLKDEGWIVFNPANKEEERDLDKEAYKTGDHRKAKEAGFNFREVYAWDCLKVIESDAIYMLPGWERSVGARGEHAVAMACQFHFPEYKIIYE